MFKKPLKLFYGVKLGISLQSLVFSLQINLISFREGKWQNEGLIIILTVVHRAFKSFQSTAGFRVLELEVWVLKYALVNCVRARKCILEQWRTPEMSVLGWYFLATSLGSAVLAFGSLCIWTNKRWNVESSKWSNPNLLRLSCDRETLFPVVLWKERITPITNVLYCPPVFSYTFWN